MGESEIKKTIKEVSSSMKEMHTPIIETTEQKYIFDRHFRATSARRATTGSGIGLSIAKEILTIKSRLESKIPAK